MMTDNDGRVGETVGRKGPPWKCEGYGRYAVPCRNHTRHESRFCAHHRNQSHWTAIVNSLGEQGIVTVEPTRTRWVVAEGYFYGGRWHWRRTYRDTEALALVVRDAWVEQSGSKRAADG